MNKNTVSRAAAKEFSVFQNWITCLFFYLKEQQRTEVKVLVPTLFGKSLVCDWIKTHCSKNHSSKIKQAIKLCALMFTSY